jgi:DNA-binding MarR family transcriptional regulator
MNTGTTHQTDLAAGLEQQITRLSHHLARGNAPELSRTAASVLAHLRDAGPQRITDLAAREAVAQPSMTSLVTRLERQRLVTRGEDAADRRAVLVAITGDGERVLSQRRQARANALAARLNGLDARERAALGAALGALEKLNDLPEDPR